MRNLSSILKHRSPVLHTFPPDATVADAIHVMASEQIGIVPILKDGYLLGVFSERDLLRRVIARQRPLENTPLRKVMTPNPVTSTASDSRQSAILKMQHKGCRHLPILANGILIDMLSMRDLLYAELKERDVRIQDLQNYITGS